MFRTYPRFDRIIVSPGPVGDTDIVERWRQATKGRTPYYLSSEAVAVAHYTPLPPAQPAKYTGEHSFSDDYA